MVAKSIERNMKNKKLSHIAFAIAGILCTSNVWTQTAIKPVYANQVSVYTTAERNNRQMVEAKNSLSPGSLERNTVTILIDPNHQFEEWIGFGGAITDAAAETLAKLPKEKQDEIMTAYFDPQKGIGYNMIRTNMNSCDFSSDTYDYVKENDIKLESFDIAHDRKYKLPFIKQAQEIIGDNMKFYFSPWSPPAWMKTNNNMLYGGYLKKEHYQTWANYFIKFIQAYEAENIPVWGLTVQNEPMSIQTWESCLYLPKQEQEFLKKYLGPTLWKNDMKNKKVIVYDHNRDFGYHYVSDMLNDPETAKYIWGVGLHWYDGGMYENDICLNRAFPNIKMGFTEGCVEGYDPNRLQSIAIGERYATNILNDMNSGFVFWTDWNIVLDEFGGPNHVKNVCFAPIHGITKTGEVVYTYAYSYIGHFSKFIRPGARRLNAVSNSRDLQTTSFINTDGHIAVVILNTTGRMIPYTLYIEGKTMEMESPAHSIMTCIL